ncbi:hypothetical protein CVT24_008582 [Panaeolus cyanescens]|uniref:Uncharacterized protein n=1 Tax=Panaeolus cyanescens TaxID=181874 RepID=A0A409VKS9_9AGAR|nr:hypothetical protein CVT24_008582 [Panaeolus cyanescens]
MNPFSNDADHELFDVMAVRDCDPADWEIKAENIAAIAFFLQTAALLEQLTIDPNTSTPFLLSGLQLPKRLQDTFPLLSEMWFRIPTDDTREEVLNDILQTFDNIPQSNVLKSIGLVIELKMHMPVVHDSNTCLASAKRFWTRFASTLALSEAFPSLETVRPTVHLRLYDYMNEPYQCHAAEEHVIRDQFMDMFVESFATLKQDRPSVNVYWKVSFD